jgi:NADH dehydrogenase (ubiquinone) 1 alpha subcomplex subunit 8
VLTSISKHIAVSCAKENAAFIECKRQDRNPEVCLEQGAAVTTCVADL